MNTYGRLEPQEPVWIPNHLKHGTSYVHRHYKCRCGLCQEWRRAYDRQRDQASRRKPDRRLQWGGWYVCVIWGEARGEHEYDGGQRCIRCGADRRTEEFWEAKWQESSNECRTRDRSGDDPQAQGRG